MRITLLVDNNTLVDRYFLAEPGLCILLEDEKTKILFDTGYSDIFLHNAARMGWDLTDLNHLVLSHKHLDHTWGLEPLIRHFTQLRLEKRPFRRPTLVAHPDIFESTGNDQFPEIGSLLPQAQVSKHLSLHLQAQPLRLSPKITFLGQIPRRNDFEGSQSFGHQDGSKAHDRVVEDSALVYHSPDGLVILTGCSHAGICNIVDYAQEVCAEERVLDIVGGLHLQEPPPSQLQKTASYLQALSPQAIHPCHCTDLQSKIALAQVAPVHEVGVGLTLTYN